jgi:hypothetical protein
MINARLSLIAQIQSFFMQKNKTKKLSDYLIQIAQLVADATELIENSMSSTFDQTPTGRIN